MGEIRRLGPSDAGALSDLSESRGWGRTPQKWAVTLACSRAWGIDDGAGGLLASITLARYVGAPDVLGGMLVRVEHERRGIATALIEHVLAEAGDAPVLLYATPYGEPLYRRLGFVERERVVRHDGSGFAGPAPAAVEVGPPTDAALACLTRLDADAFGADRTPLIEAIAGLPGTVVAVHRQGEAAGLSWCWDDQRVLGPVSARSRALAADVVAALGAGAERVRVDVHDAQLELASWCRDRGLARSYDAPAMVRPGTDGVVPARGSIAYRTLASQGFG